MADTVIETRRLARRFGKAMAVDNLDLDVARGSVFGFIGRNGAGKTTTVRMLLGLLPMTAGSATVLGLDARKRSFDIKQRVGYVPETHHFYQWMTVGELTRFTSSFYPTWQHEKCAELLDRFELDRTKKIKELSKGMVAKLALTLALAHDPELLVLDEPTGGLDVMVRRDFLESIVRMIQEEGKTVFLSSHVLTDMERIADDIAIIEEGRLVKRAPLQELKEKVKKVRLTFRDEPPADLRIEGARSVARDGREWLVTYDDFSEDRVVALRKLPVSNVQVLDLDLEEIFVVLVGRKSET
jgi:ABC-2 type transport system ATP-binding protein